MEGFTYRGKHIEADMGCMYVPDHDEMGMQGHAWNVNEENMEGHDGAVWFSTNVNKGVFSLNCVYENKTRRELENIRVWLDRRNSGELIFDDRPYAIYTVRPTERVVFTDYVHNEFGGAEKHSGTFTIQLTAYRPFAETVANSVPSGVGASSPAIAQMAEELIVLNDTEMPAAPDADTRSFALYNCGNENADTVIEITGEIGEGGMTITNRTTGQQCIINPVTTDTGKVLRISSATGRVEMVGGTGTELAFEYHDGGYITVSPCMDGAPMRIVTKTAGAMNVTLVSGEEFTREDIGRSVYVGGKWLEINSVTSGTVCTVATDSSLSGTTPKLMPTLRMNRIAITGSNIDLDTLKIVYKAKVR